MLLEFSVENFLSFKNKVTFSMLADSTKQLKENYIEIGNNKILKTAAIYGANASGKSNLLKILLYISSMMSESNITDINATLPIVPFKFNNENKPSKFEIKFIKNNIKYIYGFSADEKNIYEEYLYYYTTQKPTKIFDRTNINEYSFPQAAPKMLKEIQEKTANNKFFLATATNWNYELTKPAYDFLTEDIVIFMDVEELKRVALKLYKNDKNGTLKSFALEVLNQADFNISDYTINEMELPTELLATLPDIMKKDMPEKPKIFQATINHKVEDKEFVLDLKEESLGTQMMFTLIPFIANVIENNKVLIIDELDKSLHPSLVQYIVRIFNEQNSAQLIFNTHDTNLLDLNELRRDQIWFTEKDNSSSSDLYSLSDFPVRSNDNIEKGYMNGKYGAMPFIKIDINLWQQN